MEIHQISASYVAEHDRILLRINTGQGEEVKFWWTRRLIMLAWPHFERVGIHVGTQALPEAVAQDPIARKAVSEFSEQKTIGSTDFQTPYQSGTTFPLGEDALLLTAISIEVTNNDVVFGIECKTNHIKLQMRLSSNLYQTLMFLLKKVVLTANWQLTQIGDATPNTTIASTDTESVANSANRPKYLN